MQLLNITPYQKAWSLAKEVVINTAASTIGFLTALPAYYVTIKKQAPGNIETYKDIIQHTATKQGRADVFKVLKPAAQASIYSSFSSWGVMLTLAEFNKDKNIAQRAMISGCSSAGIESYSTYRSLWNMTSKWAGHNPATQYSNVYAKRVLGATLGKNFISNPLTLYAILAAGEHTKTLPASNLFVKYPVLANVLAVSIVQPIIAPLNTLQTHVQFDPSKSIFGHFSDICKISPFRLFRGCSSRMAFQGSKLGILSYTAQQINKFVSNQSLKR